MNLLEQIKETGLVLEWLENQDDEMVPSKEIYFHEGEFYLRTLECWGSSWLGLGICQCVNHDWYSDVPVTEEKVLKLIEK